MKFLTFVRHAESFREQGPPQALMAAMGEFVQKSMSSGKLVDTGGLKPSSEGTRIQLRRGELTVMVGPFTESREIIGGWAFLNTASKVEALEVAREFMDLHRRFWPAFEGECEIRPMFDMDAAPGQCQAGKESGA